MSRGAAAAVYVKELGDGDYEVQNVVTAPHARREGLQRELWGRILADADAEGAHLLLTVGSGRGERNGGMSSAQLYDWYCRLGFHGIAGGKDGTYVSARMERVPVRDE